MRHLIIAAAALAVAGFATPASAQCDTRFVLVNRAGVQVNEFYFGPSTNQNWGADQLGAGVLPSGREQPFDTGRPGPHDFRVVYANGRSAEVMRANICSVSRVIATPSGLQTE